MSYCDSGGNLVRKYAGRFNPSINKCIYREDVVLKDSLSPGTCSSRAVSPPPTSTPQPSQDLYQQAVEDSCKEMGFDSSECVGYVLKCGKNQLYATPDALPSVVYSNCLTRFKNFKTEELLNTTPQITQVKVTPEVEGVRIDDGTEVTLTAIVSSFDPNSRCYWKLHQEPTFIPRGCTVTETFHYGDAYVAVYVENSRKLISEEKIIYLDVSQPSLEKLCSFRINKADISKKDDLGLIDYCIWKTGEGKKDPRSNFPLNQVLLCVSRGERAGLGTCAVGGSNEIGIFQYIPDTWKRHGVRYGVLASPGESEYDSGSMARRVGPGCWGTPGPDPSIRSGNAFSWPFNFGGTNDGGAWNPYRQIVAAAGAIAAGSGSEWFTYSPAAGQGGPYCQRNAGSSIYKLNL